VVVVEQGSDRYDFSDRTVAVYRSQADADAVDRLRDCIRSASWGECSHLDDPIALDVDVFDAASILTTILRGWIVIAIGLTTLLAATFIGADRTSRSLATLLTWEPRRTRVILTKLA